MYFVDVFPAIKLEESFTSLKQDTRKQDARNNQKKGELKMKMIAPLKR
jgi:hypothetical protein